MNQVNHKLKKWTLNLVAVVMVAAFPVISQASGISFCNVYKSKTHPNGRPVIVQGASFVNGMLVRGQPMVVLPGKIIYDGNLTRGFRQITIYDAEHPNVILLRETFNFPGVNVFLYIKKNTGPGPYPLDLITK